MEKTLRDFAVGETGRVKRLTSDGKIRRRLFDMGLTAGASVTLRKVAPLGDPIEVTLRGYELSLRKDEAATVIMETNG